MIVWYYSTKAPVSPYPQYQCWAGTGHKGLSLLFSLSLPLGTTPVETPAESSLTSLAGGFSETHWFQISRPSLKQPQTLTLSEVTNGIQANIEAVCSTWGNEDENGICWQHDGFPSSFFAPKCSSHLAESTCASSKKAPPTRRCSPLIGPAKV